EVVEVLVEVLAVGDHLAPGGTAAAVEAVHEGALAGTGRAEQGDELTGLDDEADVAEQGEPAAAVVRPHDLLEPVRLEAEAAAGVHGVDDAADEREQEGADADAEPVGDDGGLGDAAPGDEDAVDAAEVADEQVAVSAAFEQGVVARDGGVRQAQ